jgi:hypothetical protein
MFGPRGLPGHGEIIDGRRIRSVNVTVQVQA